MFDQDKQAIINIITKRLPRAHIYLFGSRARQDNKPESDIDIAIDNKQKIDLVILSEIKEAIEESSIPFTIDILDLNNTSESIKTQILKDKVAWK